MVFLKTWTEIKRVRSAQKSMQVKGKIDKYFESVLEPQIFRKYERLIPKSRAQSRQDLILLVLNGFVQKGFFIEIGASDGKTISNTHLLSMELEWSGILVEPAKIFQKDLLKNRPSDTVDFRAVTEKTGTKRRFYQSKYPELSTLQRDYKDAWSDLRSNIQQEYFVDTVTLKDLILQSKCPAKINFLSIDVEGFEKEVLSSLGDCKVEVEVICFEHSNIPSKIAEMKELMYALNYRRLEFGVDLWDEWYCSENFTDLNSNNLKVFLAT